MLTFSFFLNDRFVMKTTTKNRKQNDRFKKKVNLFKISFLKRSLLKKIVFSKQSFYKIVVSLTMVEDEPSLTIFNHDPSLTIVNDDPLLTIVKDDPSNTIVFPKTTVFINFVVSLTIVNDKSGRL